MACIHAQYYTNVQTILNTPKLIPYLNQGTQKIPAQIFFLQKNPRIENFNLPDQVMAQSIPSMPTSPTPLTGHLPLLFGKAANAPWWGRVVHTETSWWGFKTVQMPHPRTTPKLQYPVNMLQMPFLFENCYNLIKTCEAPFTNHS